RCILSLAILPTIASLEDALTSHLAGSAGAVLGRPPNRLAQEKSPGKGPGLSIGCLWRRSVPAVGHAAEPVVQADAEDVVRVSVVYGDVTTHRAGDARRNDGIEGAETYPEVLHLCRPVVAERVFNADADGPSGARCAAAHCRKVVGNTRRT